MIPFLPYSSEKVNANFLSLGVFLPLLLFHYRLLFWYSDLYTLFNPASCSPALCRFLEPLALSYLPTFLLFFLIREKNHLFFCKVWEKIPLFSQYFYALTKGEIFLCKNPLLGCFLLMLFIFFYLFLVYFAFLCISGFFCCYHISRSVFFYLKRIILWSATTRGFLK